MSNQNDIAVNNQSRLAVVSEDLLPFLRDLVDLHYRQRKLMMLCTQRVTEGLPPFTSSNEEAMQLLAFAQDEEFLYKTYSVEEVERLRYLIAGSQATLKLLREEPASAALN